MSARLAGPAPLSLILLNYQRPLAEVDAAMARHVAWLELGFAEGVFVAAGRRDPRTGGVILCRGAGAEVEALVATDPFVSEGLATAEVVAFNASFAVPELAGLLRG